MLKEIANKFLDNVRNVETIGKTDNPKASIEAIVVGRQIAIRTLKDFYKLVDWLGKETPTKEPETFE